MDKTLLFLIKLAWESRLKLPLLITIGFMILDIRMQLEITIETRRVRRARVIPIDPDVDNIPEDEDDDDLSESKKQVKMPVALAAVKHHNITSNR